MSRSALDDGGAQSCDKIDVRAGASNIIMMFHDYFQHLYVVNLPSRADRRRDTTRELSRAGIPAREAAACFFPAIRSDDAGPFPSIGARGCFLSQLQVLKDARAQGFERILLVEDDLAFAKDFDTRIGATIAALETRPWDIFYGGHRLAREPASVGADGIAEIGFDIGVETAHMVAFQGPIIGHLADFLEAVLTRQPGDPRGGPMHVDGAYTTFRLHNPDVVTLAAIPALGFQRSSRSDIYGNAWYDRTPVVRTGISALRRFRNGLR